jgi:WD40 repeat protein
VGKELARGLLHLAIGSLLLLTASSIPGFGQKPQQEPLLQIDAGMHIAPIIRISINTSCRLMLTGAKDKVARLWRLPEGAEGQAEQLHTLRVPIGNGDQGKIFAVALSPNGRLAAAGGWDVYPQQHAAHAVYVFDTATGKLIHRLAELGSVLRQVVFSPDNRYLVATVGDHGGIRAWDTESWRLIAEDHDYEGDSYGAAFDDANRLYTVAFDGYIRRYSSGFRLETKVRTIGGSRPFTVAISPKGDLLAVGFDRSPVVDIYATEDLRWLYAPDTADIDNGDLNSVAWASDGSRLFAAGTYQLGGERVIRVWDRQGRDRGQNVAGASNTIHQLAPCGNKIAVAAADPAFGLIDASGEKRLWSDSAAFDARGKTGKNFVLSPDGTKVRFGLGIGGERPVLFDARTGRLVDSLAVPSDMADPDTRTLTITDWQDKLTPKLDGKDLTLQGAEISHSLAIAPGAERFVLGTEWHLRAFARDGTPLWARAVSAGGAWGVNISRDGRFVVAAYGDGTIRWHRLDNGNELLALFVNAKDRRWVAWTPKGYYTASPGGESLIGWHVNRDWEETSDFFPVDRFRDRFYRPDVVLQALATLDEDKAIAEADRLAELKGQERDIRNLLPPVLEILSPKDGASFTSPNVTIQYAVRSPTGEAFTEIEAYLDEKRVSARGFAPVAAAPIGAVELNLPRRNVKVTLRARSGERTSVPVSIDLRWAGSAKEAKPKPRLRALLIGVNDYSRFRKLLYADADARNLESFLKGQRGKAFSDVESKSLINPGITEIRDGLTWLENTVQEGDLSIVLLSGHGWTWKNIFYFLPAGADPGNLRNTALPDYELVSAISNLPGGKLVFIDACRAGSGLVPPGAHRVPVDINKLANDMAQPLGAIFFGSSSPDEESKEDDDLKAGVFTAAVIEGLMGKARYREGGVTTDQLWVWLRGRVPELTQDEQHPLHHQSAPVEYILAVD